MADKYRHIKKLPIIYTNVGPDSVQVYIKKLLIAYASLQPSKKWLVQFHAIHDDAYECDTKQGVDKIIREQVFDWICDIIDPVHKAASEELIGPFQDAGFGLVNITNNVTNAVYDTDKM